MGALRAGSRLVPKCVCSAQQALSALPRPRHKSNRHKMVKELADFTETWLSVLSQEDVTLLQAEVKAVSWLDDSAEAQHQQHMRQLSAVAERVITPQQLSKQQQDVLGMAVLQGPVLDCSHVDSLLDTLASENKDPRFLSEMQPASQRYSNRSCLGSLSALCEEAQLLAITQQVQDAKSVLHKADYLYASTITSTSEHLSSTCEASTSLDQRAEAMATKLLKVAEQPNAASTFAQHRQQEPAGSSRFPQQSQQEEDMEEAGPSTVQLLAAATSRLADGWPAPIDQWWAWAMYDQDMQARQREEQEEQRQQQQQRTKQQQSKQQGAGYSMGDGAGSSRSKSSRSTTKVGVSVKCATKLGQCVVLVGSHALLGSWRVEGALLLKWSTGHVWRGSFELPADCSSFEYKAVLTSAEGPTWEAGSNRQASLAGQHTSLTLEHTFRCSR